MKIDNVPILYINMDKDTEREERLLENMDKLGLNGFRIEAVNGRKLKLSEYRNIVSNELDLSVDKLKPEYWLSRKNFKALSRDADIILPRVGCLLSHYKAIKMAHFAGLNNVLILEDDAILLKTMTKNFNVPSDADVLYFGGTFSHETKNPTLSKGPIIKINTDKLKLYGMFGYYIPTKEKIADMYNVFHSTFLDGPGKLKPPNWRSGKVRLMGQNNDRILINFFQKYGNCYFLNPVRIYHLEEGDKSNLGNKKYSKRYGMKFHYNDSQLMGIKKNMV